MRLKTLILAVLVLAALAAVAYYLRRPAASLSADPRIGQPLVDRALVEKAVQVRVGDQGKSVVLTRQSDGTWRVSSYFDLPADFLKLTGLVSSLTDAKLQRLVTTSPGRIARLEFKDTNVALLDSASHETWSLTLGKAAETGRGRFVRFGSEQKAFLTDFSGWLDADAKSWANPQLLNVNPDTIAKINISFAEGGSVVVSRAKKEDAWTAEKPPANQKVKADRIASLLASLSNLRFSETTDPADPGVAVAKANLRTLKLTTFDHKTITVALGRKPEEKKPKAPTAEENKAAAPAPAPAPATAVTPPPKTGAATATTATPTTAGTPATAATAASTTTPAPTPAAATTTASPPASASIPASAAPAAPTTAATPATAAAPASTTTPTTPAATVPATPPTSAPAPAPAATTAPTTAATPATATPASTAAPAPKPAAPAATVPAATSTSAPAAATAVSSVPTPPAATAPAPAGTATPATASAPVSSATPTASTPAGAPAPATAPPAPPAPLQEYDSIPPGPVYVFIADADTSAPINAMMAKRAFQIPEYGFTALPQKPEELFEAAAPPPVAAPATAPTTAVAPGPTPASGSAPTPAATTAPGTKPTVAPATAPGAAPAPAAKPDDKSPAGDKAAAEKPAEKPAETKPKS